MAGVSTHSIIRFVQLLEPAFLELNGAVEKRAADQPAYKQWHLPEATVKELADKVCKDFAREANAQATVHANYNFNVESDKTLADLAIWRKEVAIHHWIAFICKFNSSMPQVKGNDEFAGELEKEKLGFVPKGRKMAPLKKPKAPLSKGKVEPSGLADDTKMSGEPVPEGPGPSSSMEATSPQFSPMVSPGEPSEASNSPPYSLSSPLRGVSPDLQIQLADLEARVRDLESRNANLVSQCEQHKQSAEERLQAHEQDKHALTLQAEGVLQEQSAAVFAAQQHLANSEATCLALRQESEERLLAYRTVVGERDIFAVQAADYQATAMESQKELGELSATNAQLVSMVNALTEELHAAKMKAPTFDQITQTDRAPAAAASAVLEEETKAPSFDQSTQTVCAPMAAASVIPTSNQSTQTDSVVATVPDIQVTPPAVVVPSTPALPVSRPAAPAPAPSSSPSQLPASAPAAPAFPFRDILLRIFYSPKLLPPREKFHAAGFDYDSLPLEIRLRLRRISPSLSQSPLVPGLVRVLTFLSWFDSDDFPRRKGTLFAPLVAAFDDVAEIAKDLLSSPGDWLDSAALADLVADIDAVQAAAAAYEACFPLFFAPPGLRARLDKAGAPAALQHLENLRVTFESLATEHDLGPLRFDEGSPFAGFVAREYAGCRRRVESVVNSRPARSASRRAPAAPPPPPPASPASLAATSPPSAPLEQSAVAFRVAVEVVGVLALWGIISLLWR